MMAPPKMLFTTVLQPFRIGRENFVRDFVTLNIYNFWFPKNFSITMATSLLRSTRDFLISSFFMFPYDEIFKGLFNP